jgi:hypothetical protein
MLAYSPTGRGLAFAAMNTKDYKRIAADRIKAAREALRDSDGATISQRRFAAMVPGLGSGTLANYEIADRYPDPHMLVAIGVQTGEPAAYLAGLVDGDEAELLRAMAKMDDADREDVMDYVLRRKSLRAAQVQEFGMPDATPPKSSKSKTTKREKP